MAILGGAVMPMVHAAVMDATSPAMGYIVPACCLAIVGAYALYDLRRPVAVAPRDVGTGGSGASAGAGAGDRQEGE